MRIALTGAHGVGKTTLARQLAEKYNLEIIPECARELLDSAGWDWHSLNITERLMLEASIARTYRSYFAQIEDNWVSDRTPLDVIAYTEVLCPMEKLQGDPVLHRLRRRIMVDCYEMMNFYIDGKLDILLFLRDYDKNDPIASKIDDTIDTLITFRKAHLPAVDIRKKDLYWKKSVEWIEKRRVNGT